MEEEGENETSASAVDLPNPFIPNKEKIFFNKIRCKKKLLSQFLYDCCNFLFWVTDNASICAYHF